MQFKRVALLCLLAVAAQVLLCGVSTSVASADVTTVLSVQRPGTMVPVPAERLLDSRLQGGAFGPLETRSLQVSGSVSLKGAAISAVVLNVTAVTAQQQGFLNVWAHGTAQPGTSGVTFPAGGTVAGLSTTPVGSDGKVSIFNGSAGSTEVVIDLMGYYREGNPLDSGAFQPLTPARVLDTRAPYPLGSGSPRNPMGQSAAVCPPSVPRRRC
jgi:hypothetical protein